MKSIVSLISWSQQAGPTNGGFRARYAPLLSPAHFNCAIFTAYFIPRVVPIMCEYTVMFSSAYILWGWVGGAPSPTWPIHVPFNEVVQFLEQVQLGPPQYSLWWSMWVVCLPGKLPGMHGIHTHKPLHDFYSLWNLWRGGIIIFLQVLYCFPMYWEISDVRVSFNFPCSNWMTFPFIIGYLHCGYFEVK